MRSTSCSLWVTGHAKTGPKSTPQTETRHWLNRYSQYSFPCLYCPLCPTRCVRTSESTDLMVKTRTSGICSLTLMVAGIHGGQWKVKNKSLSRTLLCYYRIFYKTSVNYCGNLAQCPHKPRRMYSRTGRRPCEANSRESSWHSIQHQPFIQNWPQSEIIPIYIYFIFC